MSAKLHLQKDEEEIEYSFELSAAAGDRLVYTTEGIEDASRTARRDASLPFLTMDQESSLLDGGSLSGFTASLKAIFADIKLFQFHDTSVHSRLRGKAEIDNNRSLVEDGGNLPSILFYLKQAAPQVYLRITWIIRQAAPFFNAFALQPDRLNSRLIDLRWLEKGNDEELGPHQMSDGTLRFIALTTLLSLPAEDLPPIIIIDEPELGLHPSAIAILADLLRLASLSTQVIVSTQSVTLVDQFEAEDIVVVERADEQSVYRRLDPVELTGWLEEYSLGTLWEKNVLGGRP